MKIVPRGYITARDMFDRIGRELFGREWTGDLEHRARPNLISVEQYEHDCKTPGSGRRGGGALVDRVIRTGGFVESPAAIAARLAAAGEMQRRDICSDQYQAERLARMRYEEVHNEFIGRLEAGEIKAAVLDPWSGEIHPVPVKTWRTSAASRYVSKGRGPIRGLEEGPLLITDAGAQNAKPRLAVVGTSNVPKQATKRKTGPKAEKLQAVKESMRTFGWDQVKNMKEAAMACEFNASRDTCRKARRELESELGDS